MGNGKRRLPGGNKYSTATATCAWNVEYAIKIFTGDWSPEVALAEAGSSNIRRSLAHFAIGMKCLYVDADRTRAAEHFQKCVNLKVIAFDFHYWSESMLLHLEDEAWPAWLPK